MINIPLSIVLQSLTMMQLHVFEAFYATGMEFGESDFVLSVLSKSCLTTVITFEPQEIVA